LFRGKNVFFVEPIIKSQNTKVLLNLYRQPYLIDLQRTSRVTALYLRTTHKHLPQQDGGNIELSTNIYTCWVPLIAPLLQAALLEYEHGSAERGRSVFEAHLRQHAAFHFLVVTSWDPSSVTSPPLYVDAMLEMIHLAK